MQEFINQGGFYFASAINNGNLQRGVHSTHQSLWRPRAIGGDEFHPAVDDVFNDVTFLNAG